MLDILTTLMITDEVGGRDHYRRQITAWLAVPLDPDAAQEAHRAGWGLTDPVFVAQEQRLSDADLGDIDAEWRRLGEGAG